MDITAYEIRTREEAEAECSDDVERRICRLFQGYRDETADAVEVCCRLQRPEPKNNLFGTIRGLCLDVEQERGGAPLPSCKAYARAKNTLRALAVEKERSRSAVSTIIAGGSRGCHNRRNR